jgi:hypothetical protein
MGQCAGAHVGPIAIRARRIIMKKLVNPSIDADFWLLLAGGPWNECTGAERADGRTRREA